MDNFSGNIWKSRMTNYKQKWGEVDKSEIELNNFFFSLRELLQKKSTIYWHAMFLEDYIMENMAPYGLRLQLFPNLRDIKEDFKRKWESVLNACSKELMKLLIGEYQSQELDIENDITKLTNTVQHLTKTKEYEIKYKELDANLEKFNRDLISKKEKKMNRDRKAYRNGRAYTWTQPPMNRKQKNNGLKKPITNQTDAYDSSSSLSSVSSQPVRLNPNQTVRKKPQGDVSFFQKNQDPKRRPSLTQSKIQTKPIDTNTAQTEVAGTSSRGDVYTSNLSIPSLGTIATPNTGTIPKTTITPNTGIIPKTTFPSFLGPGGAPEAP